LTSGTEKLIVNAIERAEEIRDPPIAKTLGQKPRLLIEDCNPDRTVAQVMTPDALVLMAHTVCRPYVLKAKPDRWAEITLWLKSETWYPVGCF